MKEKFKKKTLAAAVAVLMALSVVPFNSLSDPFDRTAVKADAYGDNFSTTITIYFTDLYNWEDLHAYYWGTTSGNVEWPGEEMTYFDTNDYGETIYSVMVPSDVTGLIFNGNGRQSVDVNFEDIYDGVAWYPNGTQDDSGHFELGSYQFADPVIPSDPSLDDSSFPDPDSSYPDDSYPDDSYPDDSYPDDSYPDDSSFPEEPQAGYYLAGSFNDWGQSGSYWLTETGEEGEYRIDDVFLSEGDEFKVVREYDYDTLWFPDGMGNNYGENGEITEQGYYSVFFRPNYDGGDDWFYNCLKVIPEHYVEVDPDIEHGYVVPGDKLCCEGDKVVLTPEPEEGYEVEWITVNDGDVNVTKNNDGTYSFTMPDEDVAVSASFVKSKIDISNAEIALSKDSFTYDGDEKNVSYQVKIGDKTLEKGVDYLFEGDLCASDVGVYLVKITGINDYNGTKTVTWKISPPEVIVTVNGEEVTDDYEYNKGLTVVAPEAPEGKKFSHWKANGAPVSYNEIYSFIVKENVDLVTVFVPDDEYVQKQSVMNLKTSKGQYNGKDAIQYTFTHSLPAGFTVKEVGLIYGTNKQLGADVSVPGYALKDLTDPEQAEAVGVSDPDDALKHNLSGKVRKYVASYARLNGTLTFYYAVGANTDCYVNAVGYIKVEINGQEQIIYTDLVSTSYNSIG